MWFVHQSSLGKPRGRTWGRDGRGQEGTKGGRKTGEVGTETRATEWKPPEDNIGGLKLTKADRRHLATCLVSHTVVTPNPILSFLRSFTFPCLFFFHRGKWSPVRHGVRREWLGEVWALEV